MVASCLEGRWGTIFRICIEVDDILAISCDPKAILEDVQKTFKLKNDKIELPEFYLGAKLQEKVLNNVRCWTITQVRITLKLL